jgi:glycosyltransferase involved in cell wall biosynthesis
MLNEQPGVVLASVREGNLRPPGSADRRPLRILHVIMRMDRGGIETSLMHLLKTVDRQRYQMDFLVLRQEPGQQDDDVRTLGSRIIPCTQVRRPWRFARDFARIMREYGPYDVIQSHTHFFGAYVLRLAAWHGIPLRIAHSRNDMRIAEEGRGWARQSYVWLMRRWIRAYANYRVAISRSAAEDLFGADWQRDDRHRMIYSGRDFSPYAAAVDAAHVRAALGLPADAFVLGHIGRFYWRKNHPFAVEIAAALFERAPRARLLLVGDGPDQADIETLVAARGLASRVVFAGARSDVTQLLKGAMDAFVFPSHHEGLGMAVVEAQAAGLPCVIATTIPEEIDVVPELIHRLPLSAPAEVWAERILDAMRGPRPGPEDAYQAVCASEFSIERSTARLCEIYDAAPPSNRRTSCGRT